MSTSPPGSTAAETSQTLDRGLAILQLLASPERAGGLTITELAAELGVGRAVVYRLVATLDVRDFVSRGQDGRVRLGLGLPRLSMAVRPMLVGAATPVLRELADRSGATAHLTIVEGTEALALAVVEPSWTDFHVGYRVGSRHPLDQGAAGRAILSARAGSTAYTLTGGELQAGAHGIAAPVVDVPGLEASVGIVSMTTLDADRHGAQVVSAARRVAAALR